MFDNLTSINFSLVSVRQRIESRKPKATECAAVSRKNQTQASFRQIRGNLVSVGLCIFAIWLLVQMEANVHRVNAGRRHSPLQAPPVVLAAPVATPGTQILPSFAVMLMSKSRFRSRFLEFTLNSSGLSIILPLLHETQTSIVQTTFR